MNCYITTPTKNPQHVLKSMEPYTTTRKCQPSKLPRLFTPGQKDLSVEWKALPALRTVLFEAQLSKDRHDCRLPGSDLVYF